MGPGRRARRGPRGAELRRRPPPGNPPPPAATSRGAVRMCGRGAGARGGVRRGAEGRGGAGAGAGGGARPAARRLPGAPALDPRPRRAAVPALPPTSRSVAPGARGGGAALTRRDPVREPPRCRLRADGALSAAAGAWGLPRGGRPAGLAAGSPSGPGEQARDPSPETLGAGGAWSAGAWGSGLRRAVGLAGTVRAAARHVRPGRKTFTPGWACAPRFSLPTLLGKTGRTALTWQGPGGGWGRCTGQGPGTGTLRTWRFSLGSRVRAHRPRAGSCRNGRGP